MSSFTDQIILNRLGCEMQGRHTVLPQNLVIYSCFDFEIARNSLTPVSGTPWGERRLRDAITPS
jgi:hypothetical protein